MLHIYLVRHGEDQDNMHGVLNGRRDQSLTLRGEAQAMSAAKQLRALDIPFAVVYTSPLVRAVKTAEIITNELRAKRAEILSDLIERDFGVMTGELVTRIPELCGPNILVTEKNTYFLSAKKAEAFPQMMTRARRLLKRIALRTPNGAVILVTHGDIGKMIYASYYELDWKEVLESLHFDNCDVLLLSPDADLDEP